MRIALVHYHLRRGWVTSVILRQAQALKDAGEDVLIITGVGAPWERGIPVAVVDELDDDRFRELPSRAQALADALVEAMTGRWGGDADIIHIHNPLIQKNAALMPALKILLKRGLRLLLQIYDLAEDFRPDMYIPGEEYPENCHYAVINSRDYSFLRQAGLKPEGLHLLPHEVAPVQTLPSLPRTRYLYPERAIRRKNIGEALLLSLFIPQGRTIAIILPPVEERDMRIYRRWVDLARELSLPVEFEVGRQAGLEELFGSALCIITTSVKESFGFSFLEPWAAGREVIGRRIEFVCRDFEAGGIQFGALYSSLAIPVEYIPVAALKKKILDALTGVYQVFGQEPPKHSVRKINRQYGSGEAIDFGCLDEELQEGIIRTAAFNNEVFQELIAMNPFLAGLADWREDQERIAFNAQRVVEIYGRERIISLLRKTYQAALHTPVTHKLAKSKLPELYLNPPRLFLVGAGYE